MTDSGKMGIHIDPYDYMNAIQVNLWLSCDVTFASRYFEKPEVRCVGILLNHTHANYTGLLVAGFVFLSC